MRKRKQVVDMCGQVFGRLIVTEYHSFKNNANYWKCTCSCGKSTVLSTAALRGGKTQSCGCLQREATAAASRSHGMSKTKFYRHWTHMRDRCNNPSDKRYKDYGGRGITVCDAWNTSFEAFFDDMYEGYEDSLSLDRVDVNGNYNKENCQWVSLGDQARNKRKSVANTSGLVGVVLFAGKNPSYVAQWYSDGKQHVRSFGINKYGEEMAKNLAYAYRQMMIETLKDSGVRYGEFHGM